MPFLSDNDADEDKRPRKNTLDISQGLFHLFLVCFCLFVCLFVLRSLMCLFALLFYLFVCLFDHRPSVNHLLHLHIRDS